MTRRDIKRQRATPPDHPPTTTAQERPDLLRSAAGMDAEWHPRSTEAAIPTPLSSCHPVPAANHDRSHVVRPMRRSDGTLTDTWRRLMTSAR
ncbi:hypothetical protein CPLU01_02953 [Colletotrichum plurivorum]|uniref:Uncharacterized protein n=1 Tax=Colletotrichum plurivorum TaxID=2175906 RepID=A0A8H6KUN3_9PEZI|nr:hypothetical protein CPLU01_02953 [Colletotrichum plurivorum]